jgi:hypothetical protein
MISAVDNTCTRPLVFFNRDDLFIAAISNELPSESKEFYNDVPVYKSRPSITGFNFKVEDFIWFELSIVNEVECVVVERQEKGKQFGVISIVNGRDPNIRKRIYERERAVIQAHPDLYFDFYVRSRMGRSLNELIGSEEAFDKNTFIFKKPV